MSLFPLCELSHFLTSMYRQMVPCERNSSYNFIPIFLKLCTFSSWSQDVHVVCRTCFSMGDLGVQVSVRSSIRQHLPWMSCERNSSFSFVLILLKLCICFRHDMRMYMWFGYNCEIIFLLLFSLYELSHILISMYRQWLPCEHNSSYNFIPIFLKLCTHFLWSENVHVVFMI